MIAEILGLAFSGVSTCIASVTFISAMRGANSYRRSESKLKSLSGKKRMGGLRVIGYDKNDHTRIDQLEIGIEIIPYLRIKVVSRFLLSLTAFIGGYFFVVSDSSKFSFPIDPNLEYYDILVLFAQAALAAMFCKNGLIKDEEWRFIKTIKALNDWFYEQRILPHMMHINEQVANDRVVELYKKRSRIRRKYYHDLGVYKRKDEITDSSSEDD